MKKTTFTLLLTCLLFTVSFAQFDTCPDGAVQVPGGATYNLTFPSFPTGIPSVIEIDDGITIGTASLVGIFCSGGGMCTAIFALDNPNQSFGIEATITFSNGLVCSIGPDGALPVDFISFEGTLNQKDIVLDWRTAWEYNNAGFSVERSFDGRTFETIGIVHGAGTTELEQSYSYVDEHVRSYAPARNIYYRLKQTDYEGASEYSKIIVVQLPTVDMQPLEFISLEGLHQPDGQVTLSYSIPRDQRVETVVSNMMGEVFYQARTEAHEGINRLQFRLPSYGSTQIYVVSMHTRDGFFTKKFMQVDTQ